MTGAPELQDHLWWLASRASGIVALGLLSASVLVGLAMAARALPAGPGIRRRVLAVHEHLSVAALVAIAIHGVTLLGDHWLHAGTADIAVPFASSYRPVFTGLGVVGGYLAAALGLGFYVRRRIGVRRWRRMHRFTTLAYGLSVVHTLGAGTDARSPALLAIVAAPLAGALVLLAVRVRGGGRRPAASLTGSARA